jgi:integrase/recombinase XerD
MDRALPARAGTERAGDWLAQVTGLAPAWYAVAMGFLVEKAGHSGSRATVETYGRLLHRYLVDVGRPEQATPLDVFRFVHSPTASGRPAPATASLRLAVVYGFYEFSQRMGLATSNPATAVQRPRVVPPPPRGLTTEEVRRLLGAIPDSRLGTLHRAMIVTSLLTGRRRTELIELRVVADDGVLMRCTTDLKGGAVWRGTLPLPASALARDASRLSGRRIDIGALLFPISGASFYAWLRRYGAAAGLDDLSPHVLRHTAAKFRREAGGSVEEVSAFLGHASIATTSVYLRRLTGDEDHGWLPVASLIGLGENGRAG